ncbi:MAG: monovalent cation/H+ antiporter subunit A, partial [Chromatiaceae bacterium]
ALAVLTGTRVLAGQLVLWSQPWLPQAGLSLALRMDGLGFLFCLLVLGIGLLIVLYANYYLAAEDSRSRFYSYLLLFQGAMLGLVLSENLLLLLVFWELTSLSSFLLIGFHRSQAQSRQGARMALIMTNAGGLALIGGVLLLGHVAGSFELSEVLNAGDRVRASPLYLPILLLVLGGAFTKSAQFPFHTWLPQAMVAPTPVSAYLHSATMVKAGVFLLARLFPVLSGTDIWFFLVSGVGLVTLLYGAYVALFQHDLKGLLAYSTISHLGLITLLFGFGTPLGAVAGVFHIINHAIFKASLFMAAGIIDHETGTRDMRRVNGLFRYMPYTAVLAMVAAASMAGVPLFNGFLSKEMFFAEALHYNWLGSWSWGEPVAAGLYGVFSVAYSVRFIHDVFFNGEPVNLPKQPHEPIYWMRIPIEILAALVLLVGVLPAWSVGQLLATAAGSVIMGPLPNYKLQLWHGFSPAFQLSLVALTGGILLYSVRRYLFALHDAIVPSIDPLRSFERLILGLQAGAGRVSVLFENGSLQRYLVVLVATTILGCVAAGFGPGWDLPLPPLAVSAATLLGALALAFGALGTVFVYRQRLIGVILLGVVGLVVALTFVRFSGPDPALTQLAVEMVTTVLFLLAIFFLRPDPAGESGLTRRLRDTLLATLGGVGASLLTYRVLTAPFDSISGYHITHSLPGGGGHNVVNVILVDFRGFDTLGEITVLAIAAIGVYVMLRGLRLSAVAGDFAIGRLARERHPVTLAMTSRVMLPLALLFSWYLLARGHNQAGGGFVAGLVTSIALILQYVASGTVWTQARLPLHYPILIAAGVGLATATGVASLLFGFPFLTSAFAHLHLPVLGDIELASAMAFDLGVYLTVVGAVMLILAELGKVAVREQGAAPELAEEPWRP